MRQELARRRLELVGLLDVPPTLDEPPTEADSITTQAVTSMVVE
jgi:hypothetical protein